MKLKFLSNGECNLNDIFVLILKIIIIAIFSVITSITLIYIRQGNLNFTDYNIEQVKICTMVVFIVYLFPFFGFRRTAETFFKYRWCVCGIILFLLVLGKYHGDSITMYDRYIQPNSGNEFVEPLYGTGRGIRSDDWLVNTPSIISNEFLDEPYSETNEILRGTETDNAFSFANVSSILSLGSSFFTFLFGKINVEYAFSFYWYAPIFLCFLSTIELCLIITEGKKFVSLLGGVLITFSSWFMWWKFPTVLVYAQMAVVVAYYFVVDKVFWKKCVLAVLFSVFFSGFVCSLYPAWQVPIGYIALNFAIWIIVTHKKEILSWKKEWFVFVLAIILSAIFIGYYLYSARDYMHAIMQTSYPGKRRDYGGMIIERMFNGFISPLFGIIEVRNPTMSSIVLSFFPIPLLMLTYKNIKEKKKDILFYGMLIISVIFIMYCTVGLPKVVCDILLLSNSTSSKVVEILSVLQVYILIIYLSKNRERYIRNTTAVWVIAILYSLGSAVLCSKQFPDYMPDMYVVFMVILFSCAIFILITKVGKKQIYSVLSILIAITLIQGVVIRPVSKGLDAIYSKPVAQKIQEICEHDDGKWIAVADNIFVSGYLVACGARTVNSVNIYPNIQLWNKLDPKNNYTNIYNRYAHIYLELTENPTSFEIFQSDVIKLKLNYDDLKKTEAKYILATHQLNKNDFDNISLTELYKKDGSYIYMLKY